MVRVCHVCLVVAAATSCIPWTPEGLAGPCGMGRQELLIDDQRGLLLTPPGHDPDTPTPLVIYHHGTGETWNAIETGIYKPTLICALGAAGYMVAGTNAHGENWGKEPAIRDYVNLHAAVAGRNHVDGVMYLAVSMGGLSGLVALARRVVPDVRAFAGIYPVTNLGYAYFDSDAFSPRIEAAYRAPPTPSQDPMSLDPADFAGVPMLFWASYGDTRVPRVDNTDAFLRRLGHPPNVRVITTTGEHGDPSNFDADTLLDFFDAERTDL
jgi:hypothetical protein